MNNATLEWKESIQVLVRQLNKLSNNESRGQKHAPNSEIQIGVLVGLEHCVPIALKPQQKHQVLVSMLICTKTWYFFWDFVAHYDNIFFERKNSSRDHRAVIG